MHSPCTRARYGHARTRNDGCELRQLAPAEEAEGLEVLLRGQVVPQDVVLRRVTESAPARGQRQRRMTQRQQHRQQQSQRQRQ